MECQFLSYLIGTPGSHYAFGATSKKQMGTKLLLSTAFHPQADGQSERTIQTLEDMLRACIIDFGGSWDTHLPLAEFVYNNNHHASIGMSPYEALYGRKCRTPVCWGEVGPRELTHKEVVQATNEKIEIIKEEYSDEEINARISDNEENDVDETNHKE